MLFLAALIVIIMTFIVWTRAGREKTPNPTFSRGIRGVAVLVMVIAGLVAITQCVAQVPAGYVGVVDFFGIVSDHELPAGLNPVNPLARVIRFSIQTKERKETMQVLSREGLTIGLELSSLYSLFPDSAASVYRTIAGGDYENVLLVPQLRSICREVTAGFQASALYSTEREVMSRQIEEQLSKQMAMRGVIIESTPLRNVTLPTQLTEAIEEKQRADQESQRMEFVLTKERQEAERKRIEGQGIADFQKIVTSGISDQLLRWKGVEATEKLANSQNTKVIIIGSGKDGLPVILDSK